MKIVTACALFTFTLAVYLPFMCSPAVAQDETGTLSPQEPEPHLVFKKSVVVKKYAEGQAHTEEHVIKKGEHLWKILREQYRMSDTSINFFCKIARAVNPDVEDLNVLQPNQNILLPFKFIPGDGNDNSTIMIQTQDYHHVVKPNEHLGQILRTQFNLPDDIIFNRITKSLIQDANPDIIDLNNISSGQTIMVPREVFAMQQFIAHDVLPEQILQQPEALPQPEPESAMPETPIPEADLAGEIIQPAPQEMSFTEEPLNNEEIEIKKILSKMTRQFEGTDNSTGQEVFTPDGSEPVTLDYSQFPTYNFPWGKKVVLDYGGKLPEETRNQISKQWKNADVVSVQSSDDMESIIGRVLDVCGFYKVEKDADYTISRDAIQLSVSGNWIVFKDSSLRNVFVVNLAQNGKSTMSPSLRSYLSGIGLDVMDIGTAEDSATREDEKRTRAAYTETAGPAALTDAVLNMLGIAFESNFKTSIFQNMYSGFTLEVIADRMFKINGGTRLIDFNNLPTRITNIIEQQGFKLLQLAHEEESLDTVAGRLLEFCGADFQPPPVTLDFDRGKRKNVSLTMPGYVVQTPSGRTLLTGTAVNESISDFLREMDIVIVKY